jgi:putative transposase
VSEARRLLTLEDENAKLKRMTADAMLDTIALRICWEEMMTPANDRKAVAHIVEHHAMSERRACKAICCRDFQVGGLLMQTRQAQLSCPL